MNRKLLLIILVVVAIVFSFAYLYRHHIQKSSSTLPVTTCGTIGADSRNGNQYFFSDTGYNKIMNCFVAPYHAHKKTSFAFSIQGVDESNNYSFLYSSGTKIEEVAGAGTDLTKGTCTSVTPLANFGVLLKCNLDGDLLLSTDKTPAVPNNF